jgi:8-oxo-dGTP diphosphatase
MMPESPDTSVVPGDYDPHDYPPVAVTVDIVVFTIIDDALRVLLIQRGQPPFLGRWALPGGFIRPEEDLETAALRELAEETGIHQKPGHLEQFGSYGSLERDPRMRVVTVGYWAIVPDLPSPTGGGDARHAELVPVSEVESGRLRLAFDHEVILADAIETARTRLEDSTVATLFCRPQFTISDLRNVYNAVWETQLDAGNFQRKVTKSEGFLHQLQSPPVRSGDKGGRPASLWTSGPAEKLKPPITRPPKK